MPDALWGAYRPLLAPFNGFEEHTRSRGGKKSGSVGGILPAAE